jgi:hypothetical protein
MDPHVGLHYIIADVPDREELVAELWLDHEMWGEISKEKGEVVLELYPRQDGEPWRLPSERAERLINLARRDLVEGKPPKESMRVKAHG